MENNYWQINDDVYKVHISADVFEELKEEFKVSDTAKIYERWKDISHTI